MSYHLGSTDEEHERLIRQARRLQPFTERFFREAGLDACRRVLDLGCGVGDVAMLAARVVGGSGEVVALERDPRSIARARARAAEAQLRNIEFVQTDIDEYLPDTPFDAVVGRYILQFLPKPASTLRAVVPHLRPSGLVAFQEGSWAPFLALSSRPPLWAASISLLHQAAVLAGVNVEMGIELHTVFQEAGLPTPRMRLEMELGYEPEFTRWASDSIRSILPEVARLGLSTDELGDLETLPERLHDEIARFNIAVPWIGLVGAWARK